MLLRNPPWALGWRSAILGDRPAARDKGDIGISGRSGPCGRVGIGTAVEIQSDVGLTVGDQ